MGQKSIRRITAVAGILGITLYIASVLLISDLPGIGTPAPQLSAYFGGHTTQMLLEGYTWGAVVAATLCFLTGFWYVLRQAEGEPGVLAMLGLGAGLVTFAVALAGLAPVLVLGYRAGALAPEEVKLLADTLLVGTTLSAWPTAVSVGAFSVLILRTGAVSRWMGGFGFVVVVAHLLDAGSFAQDGLLSPSGVPVYVAPVLYYLWMLVLSLMLLRAPREARIAATPASVQAGAR